MKKKIVLLYLLIALFFLIIFFLKIENKREKETFLSSIKSGINSRLRPMIRNNKEWFLTKKKIFKSFILF
jgi:hypothetical protein